MRKYLFLVLFWGLAVPPALAAEYDALVVHGEGELRVKPDLLRIEIMVRAREKSAKAAQAKNAEASAALEKNLRSGGVEAKEIQTQGYSVDPEYDFVKDKRVFRGYVASQYIQLRLHKLESAADLLDKIVVGEEGDTLSVTVSGAHYETEKRREYETQALGAAVANARIRGEALAKAAGRSLKEVRRITDSQVGMNPGPVSPRLLRGAVLQMGAGGGPSAPELAPGEILVTSSVTIEFSL